MALQVNYSFRNFGKSSCTDVSLVPKRVSQRGNGQDHEDCRDLIKQCG